MIEMRTARSYGNRGRGRPAKVFVITDAGRSAFEHTYDDLATSALRFIEQTAGPEAVAEFARQQVSELERRYAALLGGSASAAACPRGCRRWRRRSRPTATPPPRGRRRPSGDQHSLADNGAQICQHHCPVAHVAAEFPQLCEAETEAFGRLLDAPVQRLATIAHGDGICTTHVTCTDRRRTRRRNKRVRRALTYDDHRE